MKKRAFHRYLWIWWRGWCAKHTYSLHISETTTNSRTILFMRLTFISLILLLSLSPSLSLRVSYSLPLDFERLIFVSLHFCCSNLPPHGGSICNAFRSKFFSLKLMNSFTLILGPFYFRPSHLFHFGTLLLHLVPLFRIPFVCLTQMDEMNERWTEQPSALNIVRKISTYIICVAAAAIVSKMRTRLLRIC